MPQTKSSVCVRSQRRLILPFSISAYLGASHSSDSSVLDCPMIQRLFLPCYRPSVSSYRHHVSAGPPALDVRSYVYHARFPHTVRRCIANRRARRERIQSEVSGAGPRQSAAESASGYLSVRRQCTAVALGSEVAAVSKALSYTHAPVTRLAPGTGKSEWVLPL